MADFARGERFRELRDARHLSQEDAAHEIGVSTKTVRNWEKGKGIDWENAKVAGRFYGVDPESLVSRNEAESSESPSGESQLDRIERLVAAIARKVGADEPEELAQALEQASEASPPAPERKRASKARRPAARPASG